MFLHIFLANFQNCESTEGFVYTVNPAALDFESVTFSSCCSSISGRVPELSYVVVTRLSICGADDTHAVAGLEVAELQQHHCQVVDKQLGVHKGHGKLDNTMVVLILLRQHHRSHQTAEDYSMLKPRSHFPMSLGENI